MLHQRLPVSKLIFGSSTVSIQEMGAKKWFLQTRAPKIPSFLHPPILNYYFFTSRLSVFVWCLAVSIVSKTIYFTSICWCAMCMWNFPVSYFPALCLWIDSCEQSLNTDVRTEVQYPPTLFNPGNIWMVKHNKF